MRATDQAVEHKQASVVKALKCTNGSYEKHRHWRNTTTPEPWIKIFLSCQKCSHTKCHSTLFLFQVAKFHTNSLFHVDCNRTVERKAIWNFLVCYWAMKTQIFCWVRVTHYVTLLKLEIYFCVAYFNLCCKLNGHRSSFFLRISNTQAKLQYLVNGVWSVQQMDSAWLSFSDVSVDKNS